MIILRAWALIRSLAEAVHKTVIAEQFGIPPSAMICTVAPTVPPKQVQALAEATSFTPFQKHV